MIPSTGDRVAEYELEQAIGSGATAWVFRARRQADGHLVALKIMDKTGPEAEQRFSSEVAALRRVSHPGVVDVVDAGEQDGRLWLAMELVEGAPLDDHVSRIPGAARQRHILRAGLEVADALVAVHDLGLVHRDIKPANILVEGGGAGSAGGEPGGRAKLVDFGFAGQVDHPGDGKLVGTLRYMAPERLSGALTDRRADLFSLGVVLFELLARRPPHIGKDQHQLVIAQCTDPAPSIAEFAPELPAPAVAIIDRLLAKAPGDRPASAHEVVLALREALLLDPRAAPWRPVMLTGRFVGHKSLLDLLVRRALEGGPSTFILHGPEGIGLSRLLHEVEGRVLVRGGRPVAAAGGGRTLPRVLEELVGPLRPAEARRALLGPDRDLILAAWPELRRTSEDLLSLTRLPTPADLALAVTEVLRRAAATPLLITVDDADLADARDLRLLQGAGTLLVATHAAERLDLRGERLTVTGLDRSQLAQVARSMMGEAGPALVWEHAARLAGRPGRLVDLARAAILGHQALPGEPTELATARVRPWEHAVRAAEAALLDGSPWDVATALDSTTGESPPDELRYRTLLVQARAALQDGRPDESRRRAAQAIEAASTWEERSEARLARAQASLRDGDLAEMAAEARSSAAAAAHLGDHGLQARWEVLLARAQVRAGGLQAAYGTLAVQLRQLPGASSAAVGVLWTAGEIAVWRCDWEQARRHLMQARERGGSQLGRRARAGLRGLVGLLWLRRGMVDKALAQLERAHQELARTADHEQIALVRARLAEARLLSGEVGEAGRLAAAALETAAQSGSRWVEPQVCRVLLRHARVLGDLDQLQRTLERVLPVAEARTGDPWAATLLAQVALASHELGAPDQARRWLKRAALLAPEDPHDRLAVRLARLALAATGDELEAESATALVDQCLEQGLDHLARLALGFTLRWTGSAEVRQLRRLSQEASQEGDQYGGAWLGVAMERDMEALRRARALGFLAMAEGRALPA